MFCDPLPLQLLSKNHFFLISWNGVDLPPSLLDNVFKYTVFFREYPLVIKQITNLLIKASKQASKEASKDESEQVSNDASKQVRREANYQEKEQASKHESK